MGLYFISMDDGEDSDNAILAWQNFDVLAVEIEQESHPKPLLESDSKEMEEVFADRHTTLIEIGTLKENCEVMNLGTNEDPKNIRVYYKMTKVEWK